MANIGVIHLSDANAEFIGEYVGPISGPRFLSVKWVNSDKRIAVAKAHVSAGATIFGAFQGLTPTIGAASLSKANMKNCWIDILPTGDSVPWSPDDVAGVG